MLQSIRFWLPSLSNVLVLVGIVFSSWGKANEPAAVSVEKLVFEASPTALVLRVATLADNCS